MFSLSSFFFYRYTKVKDKIIRLNAYNIKQTTEEISEILEEGEIQYPTKGLSIMKMLVKKTQSLYQEPSFATLVKVCHNMIQQNPLAG